MVGLKQNFQHRTAEAEQLKFGLSKATEVLTSATNLLGKLSGERARWELQVKEMSRDQRSMPFDSLLAAAFITYLPHTAEDVRKTTMAEWSRIVKPDLPALDFMTFMSTESVRLQWKAEGLAADNLSVENAITILHSSRFCLLIDPSTKASEWLKTRLRKGQPLEVISQHDANFNTQLELAVRFGKVLVIEEVDRLEAVLYPLLRKDLITQGDHSLTHAPPSHPIPSHACVRAKTPGGRAALRARSSQTVAYRVSETHAGPRKVVQIGEKLIDFNENFK